MQEHTRNIRPESDGRKLSGSRRAWSSRRPSGRPFGGGPRVIPRCEKVA